MSLYYFFEAEVRNGDQDTSLVFYWPQKYLHFYRAASFLLPTSFMLCLSPSHKVSVMSVLRSGNLLFVCSPVEPNSLRLPPGTEDLK